MKLTRRNLLLSTAALAGVSELASTTATATTGSRPAGSGALQTLNGGSLPRKMVGGAKELHLSAGEFEHEFASGCRAKCWGYNGTTPGPTIEAVEGERV